jgi:hypothetical protein
MKNVILFLLFIFLSPRSNAQNIYFSTESRVFGTTDLNCNYHFRTRVAKNFSPISEVAISPDGRMLGQIGYLPADPSINPVPYRICSFDVEKNAIIDTIYATPIAASALTITPKGICYFGLASGIFSLNLETKELNGMRFDGLIPGDIQYMYEENALITQSQNIDNQPSGQWILKIDLKTQKIDTIMSFPLGQRVFGLTTQWDYNTKKRRLYASLSTNPFLTNVPNNTLIEIDLENKRFNLVCNRLRQDFSTIWGLASDDDVRTQFNVRLDLDADNSSGRYVDHFLMDTLCITSMPIADQDASVRSFIGGIDSIVIEIKSGIKHPGEEQLESILRVPGIQARIFDKRKLILFNTGRVGPEVFETALKAVRYRITATNIQDGERMVLCHAYRNGVKSDPAMAFLKVRAYTRAFAGNDSSIQGCERAGLQLMPILGPNAKPGGTWVPPLQGPNNVYWADLDTASSYLYIVGEGNCPPDTAKITVLKPHRFPAIGLNGIRERTRQFVELCAGDSVVWDISAGIMSARRYYWEDQSVSRRRVLTKPGPYFITIEDFNGCTWSAGITILAGRGAKAAKREKVTLRPGEIYVWENQVIRQDTLICRTIPRPGICDSTYCLEVRFRTTSTRNLGQNSDWYVPGLLHDDLHINIMSRKGEQAQVLEMQVSDQWGRVVWRGKNFAANALGAGWDGRSSGGVVPPGMYIVLAKLRLPDGSLVRINGKVIKGR